MRKRLIYFAGQRCICLSERKDYITVKRGPQNPNSIQSADTSSDKKKRCLTNLPGARAARRGLERELRLERAYSVLFVPKGPFGSERQRADHSCVVAWNPELDHMIWHVIEIARWGLGNCPIGPSVRSIDPECLTKVTGAGHNAAVTTP